ncbi:uncharacterized protein EV420DRAFT_1754685 [Desarmillaria tabescens]|uniref:Uncharacterized protein n=1 Tax=Armillaria tabescens TaxID=1929756 RepID=A0AA39J3Y3_ARMTA|nr:uncharacterized protein EV420DRAFT_1754685 [Desarmillaria tabescens]KAK0433918.1 hypothetical protein EV420DRAFT_1754685 [Desarmillaria tabescens]
MPTTAQEYGAAEFPNPHPQPKEVIATRERQGLRGYWQGQPRHTEDYEVKYLEENRGRQVKICERETTHVQDREYRRDTMFSGIREIQKRRRKDEHGIEGTCTCEL